MRNIPLLNCKQLWFLVVSYLYNQQFIQQFIQLVKKKSYINSYTTMHTTTKELLIVSVNLFILHL